MKEFKFLGHQRKCNNSREEELAMKRIGGKIVKLVGFEIFACISMKCLKVEVIISKIRCILEGFFTACDQVYYPPLMSDD